MLPVGSLAVTPVSAVEVGDDCSLVCDDDREGTFSRDRFFPVCAGAPKLAEPLSPSALGTGAACAIFVLSLGRADDILTGGVGDGPSEVVAALFGCRS